MTTKSHYIQNRCCRCVQILLFCTLISTAASAQDPAESDKPKSIEEIVVLGTKRLDRSPGDLAVSVDVLSSDDLHKQGSSDLLDILSSVAPSYNVGREPISDASTLIRPANLRGLPSDSTLIFVNNRRRHKSSVIAEFVTGVNQGSQAVDLFPLISLALKQVEILRDGGSAQYGSDAIAGVINFRLEDDPTVRKIQVQAGSSYAGDGDNYNIAGVFGVPLLTEGFAVVAFEYGETGETKRGSQLPAVVQLNSLDDRPDPSDLTKLRQHNTPNPAASFGAPKVSDIIKLMFNAELPASESLKLYSFGTYSSRKTNGSFYYRNPYTQGDVFASKNQLGVADELLVADLTPGAIGTDNSGLNLRTGDGINCPSAPVTNGVADASALRALLGESNCFTFYTLFPDGYAPRFGGTITDASISGGLKGTLTSLTYDVSLVYGQNKTDYLIFNTPNPSYGPTTLTRFNIGERTQTDLIGNIDFTLPIDIGTASPLLLAFGAQYHDETYSTTAGQAESWQDGGLGSQGFFIGSHGFSGFNPAVSGKNSRTNQSVYFEADLDITSKWLAVGSIRYDDYSDFGSTTNAKFASRFKVTDNFNIRGALSTGFRAPSVGQNSASRNATTLDENANLILRATVVPTSPIAIVKGGRLLQPEKSKNFTIGAAFNLGAVDVVLDWYYITVKDRLVQTTAQISEADRIKLRADGTTIIQGTNIDEITEVSFFVNDFNSKTTGVDLVANLPVDWGAAGHSNFTLAYSWTDTQIERQGRTISVANAEIIEDGLPEHRATLTWLHNQGRWSGLVRANYYSSIVELLYGATSQRIKTSDITLVDAELSFDISGKAINYTVSVGIKNVFNQQPDKHRFADTADNLGADYPLTHPAGFGGGSYYLRLSAAF